MEYVALFCRLTVAGAFLVALVLKGRSGPAFDAFVDALRRQAVVPTDRVRGVARATIAAEAAVVVLLIAPPTVAAGFVAAALVLGAFVVGIVAVLRRGTTAPCHCFGSGGIPLGPAHVVRNLALIGLCVVGLIGAGSPTPEAGGIAVAAAGAVIATLIVVVFDEIVEAFRGGRPSWAS